MKEIHTHAPLVRYTKESLWTVHRHALGGKLESEHILDVAWIREAEAEIVFMHGGVDVSSFGTYCDTYGFMSCLDAIGYAIKSAERYGVGPDSSAEIVVRLHVFDRPVLAPLSQEAKEWNLRAAEDTRKARVWSSIPEDLRLRVPSAEDAGGFMYPQLKQRSVTEPFPAWSTKSEFETAQEVAIRMRARFTPPEIGATDATELGIEASL